VRINVNCLCVLRALAVNLKEILKSVVFRAIRAIVGAYWITLFNFTARKIVR